MKIAHSVQYNFPAITLPSPSFNSLWQFITEHFRVKISPFKIFEHYSHHQFQEIFSHLSQETSQL